VSSQRKDRYDYWKKLIERQSDSDLTIKDFCFHEGVSTRSFYTWRRKLRSEIGWRDEVQSVAANFIDLGSLSGSSGVHIDIGNKFRICVLRGFNQATLRATLEVVGECIK